MLVFLKKVKRIFYAIGILFLVVVGYGLYREYNPIMMQSHTDQNIPENVEELIKDSEHIVKAEVLGNVDEYVEYDEDGTPIMGYTLTKVKVTEAIEGDISNEEIVTVYEPYYYYKVYAVQKYLMTIEDYTPMEEGKEYIVFLKRAYNINDDVYYIVGNGYGKFLSNIMRETQSQGTEQYKKLQSEVFDRYLNKN